MQGGVAHGLGGDCRVGGVSGDCVRDDGNERGVGRDIVGGARDRVVGGGSEGHSVDVAEVNGFHLGCSTV